MPKKKNILLFCDHDVNSAATVRDHIQSFLNYSKHNFYILNPRHVKKSIFLNLDIFDGVVIHYTLSIMHDTYLASFFKEKIARFTGFKILFIQDDYRWVNDSIEEIKRMRITVLYTVCPEKVVEKIYPSYKLPGVQKISTLTGYVPEYLKDEKVPLLKDRSIDVGYRGRCLPPWLGHLAREKMEIGDKFLRLNADRLVCDIAWDEGSRIYGKKWIHFIKQCKSLLGTESGASIVDFDGSLEAKCKAFLKDHPGADYDQLHKAVLEEAEGKFVINVISPRYFEAIALRTALISFEGEYSGVIHPWEHYIPLKKDLSNMEEVIQKVQDSSKLQEMVERAYRDIIASNKYSYQQFIQNEVDPVLDSFPIRKSSQRDFSRMIFTLFNIEIKLLRMAANSLVLLKTVIKSLLRIFGAPQFALSR